MTQTLIVKANKAELNDFNQNSKTYNDTHPSRWAATGVYTKASIGDNVIFISNDKTIIGTLTEKIPLVSISCNKFKEYDLPTSKLFQLDALHPELMARANKHFPPFIHPIEINIEQLKKEIENEAFIYYHIAFDRPDFIISWINPNDRIILLNEEFQFLELYKRTIGGLKKLDLGAGYFTIKGYDIDSLIAIQKARNKTKLSKDLKKIKTQLQKNKHFLFPSFSNYYDNIHNKSAYQSLPKQIAPLVKKNYDIQYYCVGFKWDGSGDQLERFKKEGIWENGYHNKYINQVKNVKIGSKIAAKTTYTEQRTISILHVYALGVVKANPKDGRKLIVEWQKDFKPFKIEGTSYQRTISIVKDKANIKDIFYHHRTAIEIAIDDTINTEMDIIDPNIPLNQILFGPPGTGKTYHTINKALEICGITIPNDRSEVKKIFDKKVEEGQIAFTTFHQSMSYEDFVEGIKPETNNDKISYPVKSGIFKELCEKAQEVTTKTVKHNNKNNEPTREDFKKLYDDLLKQLPDQSSNTSSFILKTKEDHPFYLFRNTYSIVVKTQSMGPPMSLAHVHLEKMLFENAKPNYPSYNQIVIDHILNFSYEEKTEDNSQKPFILIIDEINRGNVSEIFGELITLIETDKRLGRAEQISLKLPYSKDTFGVPENVYIIGTMNTADRSVEALDSALRRRFSFEEMPPKPELVASNKLHSKLYSSLLW